MFVSHDILNDLNILSLFAKARTECVTQDMWRNVWQQNRLSIFFYGSHLLNTVVVVLDLFEHFAKARSPHSLTTLVKEDKVRVTIYFKSWLRIVSVFVDLP